MLPRNVAGRLAQVHWQVVVLAPETVQVLSQAEGGAHVVQGLGGPGGEVGWGGGVKVGVRVAGRVAVG